MNQPIEPQPLTPADPLRCQTDITRYNPWVMGGPTRTTERCSNKPTVIATEEKPDEFGRKGEMSLCDNCRLKLIEQFTKLNKPMPIFKRIRRQKRKPVDDGSTP